MARGNTASPEARSITPHDQHLLHRLSTLAGNNKRARKARSLP